MALHIVDHAVLKHALTQIRDKATPPREFRSLVQTAGLLLAAEALRALPVKPREVETPVAPAQGWELARPLVLLPVLRAGLGLVDPFLQLVPEASVGHLGAYRHESTLEPVEYYVKLPPQLAGADAIVLDPMLATGGSANWALSVAKRGNPATVTLVALLAAPEGVEAVRERHPDVTVYTAVLDERLNDQAYIVPGLGDAGDRLYGTG